MGRARGALKRVKEQLRALPERGLGYGLLRYLNAATAAQLAGRCGAAAWLQLFGAVGVGGRGLDAAAEAIGLAAGIRRCRWRMVIEINALTLDGPRAQRSCQLVVGAGAADGGRGARTGGRLVRALAALVRHVAQPGAGGRTPSDLPLVALTQGEIERLERGHPQLEDILPLSPLQEGLLFHALYDAQAPDVYTVQLELELVGALDGAALAASAQALIERHASLRAASGTSSWAGRCRSSRRGLRRPGGRIDLSGLEAAEREQRLAGILRRTAPNGSIWRRRR